MDTTLIWQLVLQVVLIALNAIFACAEIAVISVKDVRLEQLIKEGNKAAVKLGKLTEQPERFLSTIQIAITLSGYLGSAAAATNFAGLITNAVVAAGVSISPSIINSVAVVLVTLILSYFTLVFGELVPKRLAMKNPEGVSLKLAGMLYAISKVFKPSMAHDKMVKACEDSLSRLGTDYLDVYFLHYPIPEEEVSIQERMETMTELKKAGKIRAIGLSNFSLEEMKAAMKYGQVDVIQPCYSLLWRYDEELLKFSRENDIAVIPYSTLAQGLLTGKYKKGATFTDGRSRAALFQPENYDRALEVTDVLAGISAKYGKTPAQGAIAWLLQTPGVTAPIVGAKNGKQAAENIQASGWQFSPEDYEAIDRASREFTEGLPHYTLFFNTNTAD